MPIYELECPKCGSRTETFEHKKEYLDLTCKKCGEKMVVVYSASNLRFTNKEIMQQGTL